MNATAGQTTELMTNQSINESLLSTLKQRQQVGLRTLSDKADLLRVQPPRSTMLDGGGSLASASESTRAILDTIDQVRTTLGGLQGGAEDQFFYEELLAALPQFVAVGPQSAGKSSVIRPSRQRRGLARSVDRMHAHRHDGADAA